MAPITSSPTAGRPLRGGDDRSIADRYIVDESGALKRTGLSTCSSSPRPPRGRFSTMSSSGVIGCWPTSRNRSAGSMPARRRTTCSAPALGACTSMTLRMYADRKGVPLDRVTVAVTHGKVHAADCTECSDNELAGRSGMIDRFERVVTVDGDDLTVEQRAKLLEIADKCPVHRTLESASSIVTRLSD